MPIRRRGLIGAFAGLLAAPALVRAESIMPVSKPKLIVPDGVALRSLAHTTIYRITGLDAFNRRLVEDVVLSETSLSVDSLTNFNRIFSVRRAPPPLFNRRYGVRAI